MEYLPIQGTYTYNTRTNYGIQDILCELNDAGIPVSVIAPGSIYGEEYIEIGFRLYPSDGYCVEEVTNLYTYAFTSDGAVWKDGILYDSYTLPAEGTPLTLGETLLNGDTVAQRGNTKVWTYIPGNYVSPIGESGDPLENHPYWYKVANNASKIGWNSITEIGDIGVENFNISSLTTAVNFAQNNTFATSTYDKILINWEAQPHQPNVEVHFGNSKYTAGGEAETARNNLIADGWIINDEGAA